MAKQGGLLTAGLIALAVAATGPPALADSPAPPRSYKEVAPGGKYVFVMIAPRTLEDDVRGWNEETTAGTREIRRVYARSGMYRNEGSAEPLWTVDWYAHWVEVASDGVHLVRHGPWASSTDQEAISFFANGELLRTYRIRELVDNPLMLERSVSHFFWEQDGRLDDARLEYALSTKDGNRLVFDLCTGQIVSESRPVRAALWGAAALGIAGLGLLAWLVWRRQVRLQATRAEPGAAPGRRGHVGFP
jgi:hypothetical protein